MLAIWKDPASGAKYSSNTKTDVEGRYRFASPFVVAERVLINDGGQNIPEHQNVKQGRKDVDFRLKSMSSAQVDGDRNDDTSDNREPSNGDPSGNR